MQILNEKQIGQKVRRLAIQILENNYSEKEIILGDIVHFGSGVQYSNVEVFNIIKSIFKSNLNFEKIDNIFNKYDTVNWVADITYAKSKYKFNPKYNLVTGLTQIYETRFK